MIKYKTFEFGREDQYNINLYQWQDKEVLDMGGKSFGRGKPTGVFKQKLIFIGHYSSLPTCLYKILEMDIEATEVKDISKKLEEHKNFCNELFSKLDLKRENNKQEIEESVEN